MKRITLVKVFSIGNLLLSGIGYSQVPFTVTGIFFDTLKIEGKELRFYITIQKNKEGVYIADFNSIDQGNGNIAFDEVKISCNQIVLKSRAGIQIEGEFTDDSSIIKAEFRQGVAVFPLEFERVEKVPDFNPAKKPE